MLTDTSAIRESALLIISKPSTSPPISMRPVDIDMDPVPIQHMLPFRQGPPQSSSTVEDAQYVSFDRTMGFFTNDLPITGT